MKLGQMGRVDGVIQLLLLSLDPIIFDKHSKKKKKKNRIKLSVL